MTRVKIETYVDGKLDSEKSIDHDDPRDRVWLAKHCWWAARNGAEVRSIAGTPGHPECSRLDRKLPKKSIKPHKDDENFEQSGDKFEKI